MERTEIFNRVSSIFKEVLADNDLILTEDMSAGNLDAWDSLSHMTIITKIQKEFNIKFKLRELGKLKNVGNIIDAIQYKLNETE